jgi:hypothetical protein
MLVVGAGETGALSLPLKLGRRLGHRPNLTRKSAKDILGSGLVKISAS